MNRGLIAALIAGIILIIGLVLYSLSAQQNNTDQTSFPSPTAIQNTPAASPSAIISPTIQAQITGVVSEVVGPVAYKNSTLIRLDTTNVYVTSNTVITNSAGNVLNRSIIREGTRLIISGTPAEGGLEATRITVLSIQPTTTPTRIPTTSPAT